MDSMASRLRRKAGTAAGLLRGGDWRLLLRAVLPTSIFYWNDFHFVRLEKVRAPARRIEGFTVRAATPDDVPALNAVHPRGMDYSSKLQRGDLCLLAFARDRPAAMAWFELQPVHRSPPNRFVFPVGEDGCWSYWVEVHPDFRLRGALVRLWQDGLPILQERGYRYVYSAIEESNRASVKSHGRLGFDLLCRYSIVRVLGVTRYRAEAPDGAAVSGWGTWDGAYPPMS